MFLKKIALALLCFLSLSVFAQEQNSDYSFISSGSKLIAGSIAYANNKTKSEVEDSTTHTTNLNLNYGYALQDNLVIGLNTIYSITRIDGGRSDFFGNQEDTRLDIYNISFYLRRYYKITNRLLFNVEGQAGILKGKIEDFNIPSEIKTNGYNLTLEPGITFQLTPRFGLIASFGNISFVHMEFSSDEIEADRETDAFNFNLGIDNLALGAILVL
ncbi:outer membrane beta-barrel protein [Wenyingzhuangia sp. IMCC45574]